METVRFCGCKGIRTCLICEEKFNIIRPNYFAQLQNCPSYVYCPECNKAWPGWHMNIHKEHPNHTGHPIFYPGVYIKLDFLTKTESHTLLKDLDELPWEISQSGRRKQNYGPKCNFKKQKLRLGQFNGFPRVTQFVQDKLSRDPLLRDFKTIEQCSLEYTRERGASIDPHIDDCWIWGERIVTVNVLGDSVLTMTPYRGNESRYNLQNVSTYPRVVKDVSSDIQNCTMIPDDTVVRLPMPEKSLMVLYGASRYNWEHSVLREDIDTRRVCIAYREFTPPYLSGGALEHEGAEIIRKAENFW